MWLLAHHVCWARSHIIRSSRNVTRDRPSVPPTGRPYVGALPITAPIFGDMDAQAAKPGLVSMLEGCSMGH